ncbi:methylenetetrahydrofolate reductase [Wallemia mellicola]|uniref:Methylenetetrahydrofolate reductase n=1 Tax=Wallemia mellicola TaxID=1708541 RepID=A0A4T0NNJ8_9BASI|nr:methylenetetrahydrofolate reductase [Wallemia mellicola]TIB87535.1 methylenetetrahydrofolate reductase [Wallemia mellicola]TIB98721.1 methylenetetrahydrofolate reductase [Wallemia mellicola]TIC16044.1 methylenetetrahydrofolate reductase [Wallemia mellicola]TIC34301.1 methylenetetrahydrofolate reductase [Wallemia mellicola]
MIVDSQFSDIMYIPDGFVNLKSRLQRLSLLKPGFVSVTWGAGGSTDERSLELAAVARDLGLDVLLHLTCTNMEKSRLSWALDKAKELGIDNILALRGDPPRGHEYWVESDKNLSHSSDLVKFIRDNYADNFCIGVGAYPESHKDSSDAAQDLKYLKLKQDLGADFVITQLFYDSDAYLNWLDKCLDIGIKIPIIPGIMPIQNVPSLRRLANLCGAHIPSVISDHLEPIKNDDALVKDYGVELSTSMVRQLIDKTNSQKEKYGNLAISAAHFCTLNLEKSVRRILANLDWSSGLDASSLEPNGLTHNTTTGAVEPARLGNRLVAENGISHGHTADGPPPLSITAHEAAVRALHALKHHPPSEDSGLPSSNKTSSGGNSLWDEFPNGRYGDIRSPAYGELDGWGASLKLSSQNALKQWGYPVEVSDINEIFKKYINGQVASLPWFEENLDPESNSIKDYLFRLAEKGWWTVGSQPAVDAVESSDQIFGFGPKNGWIFQKAFVEFWVPEHELEGLCKRLDGWKDGGYYAGNAKGEMKTNFYEDTINAVTWGIFPGQEVVQTTIIEDVSFNAWREEAFEIWLEWSMLYSPKSASQQLMKNVHDNYWLVSVVHHDYKDTNGLWEFLLS